LTIKLSVIIPSYNRYPLNLWGLHSLENQNIPSDQIEILFIDDCSTDETYTLKDHQSRYSFTYIRNASNKGRAASRNVGIELARGELVLFLDSEMIAEPEFLRNHINHHLNEDRLVVSGAFYHKGVFTMYYPQFSNNQLNHIKQMSAYHGYPLPQLNRHDPTSLVNDEDISSLRCLQLSFPNPYFPEIAETFGDELRGYRLPWTVFLSGNVSLKKDLLLCAGGFDENFTGWGYEDWELGYRLFKEGAKIISKSNIKAYHQEHPVPPNFIEREMLPNFYHFQNKHSSIEIKIHALFLLSKIDRVQECYILDDYFSFVQEFQQEYKEFLDAFSFGLEQIAAYLASMPVHSNKKPFNRYLIRQQRGRIIQMNKYHHLLSAFNIAAKRYL
jgi:glycosyltransferase involved in cell wall biosynthesis